MTYNPDSVPGQPAAQTSPVPACCEAAREGDVGRRREAEVLGQHIASVVGQVAAGKLAHISRYEVYPVEVKLPDDPTLARRVRGVANQFLEDGGWQPEWLGGETGVCRVCVAKRVFTTRWWPPAWVSLVVSVVVLVAGVVLAGTVPMPAAGQSLLVSVLCAWVVIACWRATASDGRWLWQTLMVIHQVRRYLPPGWAVSIEGGWVYIKQKLNRKQDQQPLMFSVSIETPAGGGAYADLPLTTWAQIWGAADSRENQTAGKGPSVTKFSTTGQDRPVSIERNHDG